MKRLMTRSMFAAAALAVAAVGASAQTLNAEIPFTFRAGSTVMAPGSYELSRSTNGGHYFILSNRESKKAIILMSPSQRDPAKAWVSAAKPLLSFECVEAQCALRELWTGQGASYRFTGPRPGPEMSVHITEILLTRAKAE